MPRFLRLIIIQILVPGILFAGEIKLKKESSRKHAPDFELKDVNGNTVHLADFAGKVILIDFWATWCVPCRSEIPWLNQLSESYRDAGLAVIGVSMDEEGWTVIKPFVEKLRVTYPVVMASKRVAYLYGDVDELPLAFFVDRQQRVAAIHLGQGSRKEFERVLKILLAASH